MIATLLLSAVLGTYPAPTEIEIVATKATAPLLVPGYPPRQWLRLPQDWLRNTYGTNEPKYAWAWLDSEGGVHFFPSENPHLNFPSSVGAVVNYGVSLEQSSLARPRVGPVIRTNDNAFASKMRQPDAPKPAPGPNPTPAPVQPNRDYYILGAAIVLVAGALIYKKWKA